MSRRLAPLFLLLATLAAGLAPAASSHSPGTLDYSFVTFGCNRIQESDWKTMEAENPSSANLPQLRQTLQDIASLDPLPRYFFFTGDLVVNLKADNGKRLRDQLNAWAPLYTGSPLYRRTTFVPLPGNHEMLQKDAQDNEVPNPACDPVWIAWLHANHLHHLAGNGPVPNRTNRDRLVDNQSEITYSFDRGDTHFVLLNTDTLNQPDQTGWIPYHWIKADLEKAQRRSRTARIFVLGHKPIVPPQANPQPDDAILSNSTYPLGDQLLALLQRTPKVVAYFCAHSHEWQARQLGHHGPWQVIAGNGGSKLEGSWQPPGGTFYGFTQVRVYHGGKVSVTSYGRCVPDPYFSGTDPNCPVTAAVPQPETFLSR